MKKYVKPELFYERFELSQHIADCMWELNQAQGACIAHPDEDQMSGIPTVFTDALGCDMTESTLKDYCYENSLESLKNIFVS